MNNQKIKMLIFFIFIFIAYYYISYDFGLGNGYKYISGRADNMYISKDKKIIVEPTIVDIDIFSNFVVGLKLPVEYFECDSGYKVKIMDQKKYFILITDKSEVFNYNSKQQFELKLKDLNIFKKVLLDYKKFTSVLEVHLKYYKNIDYSKCKKFKK